MADPISGWYRAKRSFTMDTHDGPSEVESGDRLFYVGAGRVQVKDGKICEVVDGTNLFEVVYEVGWVKLLAAAKTPEPLKLKRGWYVVVRSFTHQKSDISVDNDAFIFFDGGRGQLGQGRYLEADILQHMLKVGWIAPAQGAPTLWERLDVE